MDSQTLTNTWPPSYRLKRHRRARHVKLRASEPHGLEITVPYRFNVHDIPSILEKNKRWIEKHLAQLSLHEPDNLPEQIELTACSESWKVEYLASNGKMKLLQRPHLKEIAMIGDIQNKGLCKTLLIMWLKNQAKSSLARLLHHSSIMMQLPYNKVTIRDQKTLWGSCSTDKSINLNYKLLFLPPSLVAHVMIHELSHTKHLNHSEKFWKLVAQYDTAWKEHRRELKRADKYIPTWVKKI